MVVRLKKSYSTPLIKFYNKLNLMNFDPSNGRVEAVFTVRSIKANSYFARTGDTSAAAKTFLTRRVYVDKACARDHVARSRARVLITMENSKSN